MAGFDWSSFATAFMNTAAANITKKKDAASTWLEQQQEMALKNVGTVQKRQSLVDRANGYYNYLTENGATHAQVQAALETGPDGIVKFAEKVASAVADRGGRKLTQADTATIISLPDTFRPTELDATGMKDYIAKTYGMGGISKGVDTDRPTVGLWDRMTGAGAKDMARARLDSSPLYDGYTALDLNELAQTAEYTSLNPGTMATFLDYKYATPEVVYKASDAIDTQIRDMRAGEEYIAAKKAVDVARSAIGLTGTGLSPEQAKANLEAAQAKIIELNRRAAGPLAKKWMDIYGTSLDESLGANWRSLFGANFFGAQEEEDPTTPVVTSNLEEAIPDVTTTEPTIIPTVVPTATEVGSILEDQGLAPEIVTAEDGNDSVTFMTPSGTQVSFVVGADGKVVSAKRKDNSVIPIESAQRIWDEYSAKATELKAQQVEAPVVTPVLEDGTPIELTPLQQRLTERGADFTDDRDPAIQKSMDFVAAELESPTTNAYGIKIKGRMPTYFTTASNLSMIPAAAIESGNVTILDIKDVPGKKQSLTKSGIQSYLKPYFDDAKAEGLMSKPAEPEAPEVKLPGLKLEDAKQLKFMLTRLNSGNGPASVEDVRTALGQYAEMRKQGFVDAKDNVIEPSTTALPKTEEQLNKLAELLYTEYK